VTGIFAREKVSGRASVLKAATNEVDRGTLRLGLLRTQSRAEQELELAQRATRPEVVAAHYRLAELYLARLPPQSEAKDDRRQDDSTASAAVVDFRLRETTDSPAEPTVPKDR